MVDLEGNKLPRVCEAGEGLDVILHVMERSRRFDLTASYLNSGPEFPHSC